MISVRVALGFVALAVADDAFVHPEQGTAAEDHVVSGILPLAIAGVLALVYPRLRAGARGAIAIVAGLLAATAGVADGYRHVVVDRMAGDDLTAMLAALAGAVLIGLGVHTLWSTRRLDERPLRRYLRRTGVALLAGVATIFALVPTTIAIVATHRAREPVPAADLGRPYEHVSFTTADDLRLQGWYVPSVNGAAIVLSPGRRGPIPHARLLARHGYGLLLFDRRGEGESDGDFNAYGWGGDADLKAAIGFLSRRPDVDPQRIGGLGLSVGGEMLLETAAEDTRLRAVVSEGGSVRSIAEHWDDPALSDLRTPVTPLLAQTAAVAILAGEAPPPSLVDLVDDISPRSVLFIRGLDGQPAEQLNRAFYDRAGEHKELWEVPGAGHTAAITARP
ncbi:MAG TPA: CocE/NonD family hydrolase, partial [Solirubrobacteraceae bacterium]|nr:CocE/NonD family hydrolase [Solirubrobacteraceae bacterium]